MPCPELQKSTLHRRICSGVPKPGIAQYVFPRRDVGIGCEVIMASGANARWRDANIGDRCRLPTSNRIWRVHARLLPKQPWLRYHTCANFIAELAEATMRARSRSRGTESYPTARTATPAPDFLNRVCRQTFSDFQNRCSRWPPTAPGTASVTERGPGRSGS